VDFASVAVCAAGSDLPIESLGGSVLAAPSGVPGVVLDPVGDGAACVADDGVEEDDGAEEDGAGDAGAVEAGEAGGGASSLLSQPYSANAKRPPAAITARRVRVRAVGFLEVIMESSVGCRISREPSGRIF
jgi:hypothetical protein